MSRLLAWAAALACTLLTIVPGIYLLVRARDAGLSEVISIYSSPRTLDLLARSTLLVVLVTLTAAVIGVGLAFLVERTDLPGRRFWRVALALPLAVPSYVAAYSWVSTVRAEGLFWSVLVIGLGTYPYVFLTVSAALRRARRDTEDVARSLGSHPRQVFWRVTFPALRPSMAAGLLLVALYALSDFGAVSLLRYDSFTRAIFMSYRASFDRTTAAVLALALMVITLIITGAEMWSRGRSAQASGAVQRPAPPLKLGWLKWPMLGGASTVFAAGLLYPVAVVITWTIAGGSRAINWPDLASASWFTLWVCALAAAVITLASLPVSWLTARSSSWLGKLVQHALYIAHGLPGLVVALAMVFLSVRFLEPIYQQTPALILTYFVLFAPLAVGAVRTAIQQSSPKLEDVAASLGFGPLQTFRRVTLPLAAPGVASAFVLVMLTAMKELPATLLMRPTGAETLATRLWMHTDELAYAAAAPYGVALVLIATIPTLVLTSAQLAETNGTRPRMEKAA